MKNALLWFGLVAFSLAVSAKSEYFSDVSEEEYKKLREFARSFLQRRIEEAEESPRVEPEPEPRIQSSENEIDPPFVYAPPKMRPKNEDSEPFAVGPSDPRFYRDFGTSAFSESDATRERKEKRPELQRTAAGVVGDGVPVFGDAHSAVRQVPVTSAYDEDGRSDIYFTAIVAGCSAAAVVAIIAVGIGCYRLQRNTKAAADVDYPAYGVTGPNKDISPTSGDRRLAQSAQMYHYQHQKQQIIAMESMCNKEHRNSISDAESEEENEEGDYTVYECPGLAPTGEMEVKNPLFQDDQTPASGAKPSDDTSEESRELPK